jgi:hypothetical protein
MVEPRRAGRGEIARSAKKQTITPHTGDIFDTEFSLGGPVMHTEEALNETGGATLLAVEQTEQAENTERVEDLDAVESVEPVEYVDEVEDASPALTESILVVESPVLASARVLEVATFTADQLVADAQAQADTLVADAQAEADALRAASREDADRAAGELSRLRDEQTADLDRERTAALSGLAEQKATLEAQVEALRAQEHDYRGQLRHQLTEHLALLGDSATGTPASVAS